MNRGIISALRFRWMLRRSYALASRHRYAEALRALRSAYRAFALDFGSTQAGPTASVLAGVIARGLGDIPLAERVHAELERQFTSPWTSRDEPTAMFVDYFNILLIDYIERSSGEATVTPTEIEELTRELDFARVAPSVLGVYALWRAMTP